jgi:Domain of unknown function (DUF4114)
MTFQAGNLNQINEAIDWDSVPKQLGNGAIQVFSGSKTLPEEQKNIFSYEGSQEPLSEFRRLFIQNLNEGRYFYPVPEGSNSNQALLYRKDLGVNSPSLFDTILAFAGVGATIATVFGASPIGAIVGAAVGAVAGAVEYVVEAAFQHKTDPFVANIYLADKVLLNGEDVTNYVLDYSQGFISAYSNWSTGTGGDSTVTFLDNEAFSTKLVDSNNQDVSKVFGTDTFILSNSTGRSLGFVIYNDPAITGREIAETDGLQIDFSKIGNVVKGDTVSLVGLPITVSERATPSLNASDNLVRLIPNFGNDVIKDFVPGKDILQLETNLTFANFDTNRDGILTPADAPVSLSDKGLVLDVSKAAGLDAGLATITLTGVNELPKQSTDFSEDVSGKPVIDLRKYSGKVEVDFDATKNKNTLYDSLIGFYKILDSRGGIDITGDGVADLHPGDTGYAAAAVQNRETNLIIKGSTKFTAELEGNSIYAPFIAVNSDLSDLTSSNVYFGFSKANTDKRSHVQLSSSNVLGFEDLLWLGDRSFNDIVVAVNTHK